MLSFDSFVQAQTTVKDPSANTEVKQQTNPYANAEITTKVIPSPIGETEKRKTGEIFENIGGKMEKIIIQDLSLKSSWVSDHPSQTRSCCSTALAINPCRSCGFNRSRSASELLHTQKTNLPHLSTVCSGILRHLPNDIFGLITSSLKNMNGKKQLHKGEIIMSIKAIICLILILGSLSLLPSNSSAAALDTWYPRTSVTTELLTGVAYDTDQYSSKKLYVFNAGGSGSDLLRIKVFSERYGFSIDFTSTRCGHIPEDRDLCPGRVSDCPHIKNKEECFSSGGSVFTVKFPSQCVLRQGKIKVV